VVTEAGGYQSVTKLQNTMVQVGSRRGVGRWWGSWDVKTKQYVISTQKCFLMAVGVTQQQQQQERGRRATQN